MRAIKTLFFFLFLLSLPSQVFAYITDFRDHHVALTLGAGAIVERLPNDNQFDPIPELAPSGVDIANSDNTYLIPARMGFSIDRPWANFEIFYRKLFNSKYTWTSTGGAFEGSGASNYNADAVGGTFAVRLTGGEKWRIMGAFTGEYGTYTNRISFRYSDGTEEGVKLKTAAQIAGIGIQPEIWLGDMWSAGLFAGYTYGWPLNWKAYSDGALFGQSFTKGAEVSGASTGSPVRVAFGGFTVELVMRLNF